MPYFSIIIPVYNAEQYLERCINSIQKQSFEDYEVLLVDDESQDQSSKVCIAVAEKDKRFLYKKKKHEGASSARNFGISVANGTYIVFVDADDSIAENMLLELYQTLSVGSSDICFMNSHYVITDSRVEKNIVFSIEDVVDRTRVFSNEEFLYLITQNGNHMPGSTCLIVCNREFLEQKEIRFDCKLIWSEDSDFTYRSIINASCIRCCSYCGYYYYIENEGSVSKRFSLDKAMGRMNVYSKWAYYFLENDNAKEKYSISVRNELVQQLLAEYCEFLNISMNIGDKKERRQIRCRMIKERSLWKNCQDYKYRDYVKYGVYVGTAMQHLKRLVKRTIIYKYLRKEEKGGIQ